MGFFAFVAETKINILHLISGAGNIRNTGPGDRLGHCTPYPRRYYNERFHWSYCHISHRTSDHVCGRPSAIGWIQTRGMYQKYLFYAEHTQTNVCCERAKIAAR